MSRLDELPPDQRAALALLLGQRKSYAEIATLLAIHERAVHDRAQAALAMLAPREARELSPERREDVGDYLLGQQASVGARLATRAYLGASPPARQWATAISVQLAPLASAPLPEIPDGENPAAAPPPASAFERPLGERLPSSRLGGALLLAAIAAAAIVAIVLITSSSGGSHAAKSTATQAGASSTGAKSATGPTVTQRLTLTSPTNPRSRIVGVMDILAEGGKRAFFIDVENLPVTKGFFYALWLYNSPTSHRPLSKSPPVGSTHRLQGGALLPSDAGSYHRVLLTRETNEHTTRPGKVILNSAFSLGA
jgi:hypothetical protein